MFKIFIIKHFIKSSGAHWLFEHWRSQMRISHLQPMGSRQVLRTGKLGSRFSTLL